MGNRGLYNDLLYSWSGKYAPLPSIKFNAIYWSICLGIRIIYFYIPRWHIMSGLLSIYAVPRTFFGTLSACRHRVLGMLYAPRLWYFIKLKGVSYSGDKIAFVQKQLKLVVVSRAGHTHRLTDCGG